MTAIRCSWPSTQEDHRAIELGIGNKARQRATRDIEIEIPRHKAVRLSRRSFDIGEHIEQLVAPEFVAASALEVRVIGYQRLAL